jgi:hypothetical protein
MPYRIQLTRYQVNNIDWKYFGAYRMRVEVTAVEGDGLDPHLFIYQQGQRSPYSGQTCDNFCAIVGPAQLADIPIGAADPQRYFPFYRLNFIELDFTAEALAMDVWRQIQEEARVLCEAMGRFTLLESAEEVWVPDIPATAREASQASENAET